MVKWVERSSVERCCYRTFFILSFVCVVDKMAFQNISSVTFITFLVSVSWFQDINTGVLDLGSRLPAAGCQSKSTQRTINEVGLWWWLHLVALLGNSSFCLPPLSLGESYSKMPLVPLTAQFMQCHLGCTVCHTTHILSLASFLSGLRFAY